MTRSEILDALTALRLKPSWLAVQIGTTRQNVYNWLDTANPTEPADPGMWERMTEAIAAMGKPKMQVPDDIRELGINLGIAVLAGDDDEARRIAPLIIRELSRPYPNSKRKPES